MPDQDIADDPLPEAAVVADTAAVADTAPHTKFTTEGDRDPEFLRDLLAAERFKAFLVSRGVEVSDEIIEGLATLSSIFQEEAAPIRGEEADRLSAAGWGPKS